MVAPDAGAGRGARAGVRRPAAAPQRVRGPFRHPAHARAAGSAQPRLATPHAAGLPPHRPRPARARRRATRDGAPRAPGAGHRDGGRRLVAVDACHRRRTVPHRSSRRRGEHLHQRTPRRVRRGRRRVRPGRDRAVTADPRPHLGRGQPRHRHPRRRHGHRRGDLHVAPSGAGLRRTRPLGCADPHRPALRRPEHGRSIPRRRSGCRGGRWDPGHDHRLRRRRPTPECPAAPTTRR